MMNYATPESLGISGERIFTFLKRLDDAHLVTHDVIIARGNSVCLETYVPPFGPSFYHRMYSVTKSIVALAVGFAADEGLVDLNKTLADYFPAEAALTDDENIKQTTIRQMLTMTTGRYGIDWFTPRPEDRVKLYFTEKNSPTRKPGTDFQYDSTGSFVMGALVERLTGMSFMDYLRPRLFDKIGVSRGAHCLSCPGGHSWGDSACLLTPWDLLLIARFVLNGGSWKGEQLLSKEYMQNATACLVPTDNICTGYDSFGYGYYIWRTYDNSFSFNGMGSQFAICVPDKDLILIYNGDNQGNAKANELIFSSFFELISRPAGEPLPRNRMFESALTEYTQHMSLTCAWERTCSPKIWDISDREYVLKENPMGIKRFTLHFDGDEGSFRWENAQGEKQIRFGLGANCFGRFPQQGYSNEIGSIPGDRLLGCAASGSWPREDTFRLKVMIIDDYFGNFDMYFTFKDKKVLIHSVKTAEDFWAEYQGDAEGEC